MSMQGPESWNLPFPGPGSTYGLPQLRPFPATENASRSSRMFNNAAESGFNYLYT